MTDSTTRATAAQIAYVMRLVEMGQLRIGPDNQVNKQAVMRLLNFDRPETFDAD